MYRKSQSLKHSQMIYLESHSKNLIQTSWSLEAEVEATSLHQYCGKGGDLVLVTLFSWLELQSSAVDNILQYWSTLHYI